MSSLIDKRSLSMKQTSEYTNQSEEVLDEMQAFADFNSEISAIRLARLPDPCRGSYEEEIFKPPASLNLILFNEE